MNISIEALNEAIQIKEEILRLESRLTALFGDKAADAAAPSSDKPVKRRRKMSAAGRAKIAAAQRARWAKAKSAK